MSLDEKIGQLFMIAGYIDPEAAQRAFEKHEIITPNISQEIDHYITEFHIGAIAYVGPSESKKQVVLTNHYQSISKYPLLIAQDLEWGLSMRLEDGLRFPKNATLGAVKNPHLIYEMGKEIGSQAQSIGVQMNLSPVLDVNTEPKNIVINVRSFSSSPQEVAERGILMIQGLQDAGIIASAKHFPGLGDVIIDPHLGSPRSLHGKKRLKEVELYPFAKAIDAGVLSIQTEHLLVPSLEIDPCLPSSLSPKIVTDLLKKQMGFTGLVLSGALRMKALTERFTDEEIAVKAFLAGNDMLLMPRDLSKAYQSIKTALARGLIAEKEIDERVLKILQSKEKVFLHKQRITPIPPAEKLHSSFAKKLKYDLYKDAVSFLRKNETALRQPPLQNVSIAYIQLGDVANAKYIEELQKTAAVDAYFFPLCKENEEERKRLFQNIENYSTIVVAVYPADPRQIIRIREMDESEQKIALTDFHVHGITKPLETMLSALQPFQEKIILTSFGNPYGLSFFDGYSTLLMAYEDDVDAQKAAAELSRPLL